MKFPLRSASLVSVWLLQSLRSLPESLMRWVPQQAPALVPIPIRADRSTSGPVSRRPFCGR